jgi:Protein kinase domain
MKPLAPNTLIQNRYLIVQLIGKGGMGDVYLAVDQRLGSAVALKRTFFADDEMLGGAFEREAKILARLRHPVLPKVSDHFTENEEQFLVMEHISGDDLFKRLEMAKKPFPLSWVLFWADQLLDALSYLHTNEPPIIHRDIKPQNLKLTDENHIVLLDFGLSKNSGETQLTNSGSVVGYTPHYAPMEQIRGMGTSPRSDIYALSATLYQLMSNTVPADALSRADALLNGMEDPLKPVFEVNPEIQPIVSDVILKGMEISQDKRHQSARDMQKALRDAFSEMQSAMAARTVVFPTPVTPAPEGTPLAAAVPEAMAAPPVGSPEMPAQQNSVETVVPVKADEFDATLRYDPAREQAQAAPDGAVPGDENISDMFSNIIVEKGNGPEMPPVRQATTEAAHAAHFGGANAAGQADAFATVTENGPGPGGSAGSPASPNNVNPPPTPPPAAKKKSKAPLIIVGLLGALVVFAGLAVGGWFAYQKYYAVPAATPTPAPSPSPTATPSPSPTPGEVLGANTANSNVDAGPDSNSNGINTAVTQGEPGVTPKAVKPTPVKTAPAKTPKPAVQNERLKTEQ